MLGILERRLTNIVKSSGQCAVFACYSVTNAGRLKLSDCAPVLVCQSTAKVIKLSKPLSQRKPLAQIYKQVTISHKHHVAKAQHFMSRKWIPKLVRDQELLIQ